MPEADERKTEGPTYPVSTIARLLMITERRVQQLVQQGVIPKSDRGRYELAPAVQGYIRFLNDRLAGKTDEGADSSSWQTERARKMKADATISELELARLRRELVEVGVVMDVLGRALSTVRTRLLAMGPTITPQVVAAGRDMVAVRELIDDRVTEALNELSTGTLDFALGARPDDRSGDPRDDAGAAEGAAEADAERVG